MKKSAEIKSTCVCGHEVSFVIAKPKYHEPTVAKSTCACGTRYMLVAMIDKETGRVEIVPQILEASERAKSITMEKLTKASLAE